MQILKSQLDPSVNFVESQLVGFIESRYVRRSPNYFTAYLSSQTGCNRGCRMCHLTATKQTQFKNCDLTDFVSQFETILAYYDREPIAKSVNIAWMARGEPLANPTVTETGTELLLKLGEISREHNLVPKFNISTIMPRSLRKTLVQCFPIVTPTIYYSLYSMDADFRRTWLPGAMPAEQALDLLAEYQSVSKKIVKLHGAFIEGENDSDGQILDMIGAVEKRKIRAEFNIVRYNPFDSSQGEETNRLDAIQQLISSRMPCKIIPRVGRDVHASCGTFVA